MEARLTEAIPSEDGVWQYAPKWDGFRCLAILHLAEKKGAKFGDVVMLFGEITWADETDKTGLWRWRSGYAEGRRADADRKGQAARLAGRTTGVGAKATLPASQPSSRCPEKNLFVVESLLRWAPIAFATFSRC
jgi:hypothetical protein